MARSAKSHQEQQAPTRALRANISELFPVRVIQVLNDLAIDSNSTAFLYHTAFRAKLVRDTKWASISNNIPPAAVNTQSLRAGGATSSFSSGFYCEAIHRVGRSKSFAHHAYVRLDIDGFLGLRSKISGDVGLNKYLADVYPQNKLFLFGPHISVCRKCTASYGGYYAVSSFGSQTVSPRYHVGGVYRQNGATPNSLQHAVGFFHTDASSV